MLAILSMWSTPCLAIVDRDIYTSRLRVVYPSNTNFILIRIFHPNAVVTGDRYPSVSGSQPQTSCMLHRDLGKRRRSLSFGTLPAAADIVLANRGRIILIYMPSICVACRQYTVYGVQRLAIVDRGIYIYVSLACRIPV